MNPTCENCGQELNSMEIHVVVETPFIGNDPTVAGESYLGCVLLLDARSLKLIKLK